VSDLLILTAAELETRVLARQLELTALSGFGFRVFGRAGVRLGAVGVGAARLDQRWPELVRGLDAPLVVSAGVCGALDPRLRQGDLVLPEVVLGAGGARHPVDPAARERVAARAPGALGGALVTALAVVATPEAKAALGRRTGAVAVDMESAAVLAAAARAGHRALAVRAVSDAASERVPPELLPAIGPDGRLSLGAVVGLIARPRTLPRALALGRATRRALHAVAAALGGLVD
jgi:nucleoside phosphorylase